MLQAGMNWLLRAGRLLEVPKQGKKALSFSTAPFCLEIDEDKLFSVFKYPNDRVKERMQKSIQEIKRWPSMTLPEEKLPLMKQKKLLKKDLPKDFRFELEPYVIN